MLINALIFFLCNLINVVLGTAKTILTVKSNKHIASIANAVNYGFYAIIVKQLSVFDLKMTIIVTIITNLIGVYLSLYVLEKLKKEKLWKISLITKDEDLIKKLIPFGLEYTKTVVEYNQEIKYLIDIFSENKRDSAIIRNILQEYDVEYTITSISNKSL